MISIIGLFIVTFGFFAPFLSAGRVPAVLFFWVGFLLVLTPSKHLPLPRPWAKWARIGLIVNVLGMLLLILYVNLLLIPILRDSYLAGLILRILNWILNPIPSLFESIFPYPEFNLPEGIVRVRVSVIQRTLYDFFNVLAYMIMGVIIGKSIRRIR